MRKRTHLPERGGSNREPTADTSDPESLIARLPSPPPGRAGWPWTVASRPLPPAMPDGSPWPRITVVTPSYNQAEYLEETIRSVLLSGYPDLEYMVVDGGSDDESVEIIRRYEPWLAWWVSERDRGQSEAINKGWSRATGELLAFLNSDDTYLPDALGLAALAWGRSGDVAMVTGGYETIDENSHSYDVRQASLPAEGPLDLTLHDHEAWLLPQPSSFFTASHLERVGRWVRVELRYTMDRELIYRMAHSGRVVLIDKPLATYRIHRSSKTIASQVSVIDEAAQCFALCSWGDAAAARVRRRVHRWRVAQGHRLHAGGCVSGAVALKHYVLAGAHRPGYFGELRFLRTMTTTAARMLAQTTGLYEPARRLRARIQAAR